MSSIKNLLNKYKDKVVPPKLPKFERPKDFEGVKNTVGQVIQTTRDVRGKVNEFQNIFNEISRKVNNKGALDNEIRFMLNSLLNNPAQLPANQNPYRDKYPTKESSPLYGNITKTPRDQNSYSEKHPTRESSPLYDTIADIPDSSDDNRRDWYGNSQQYSDTRTNFKTIKEYDGKYDPDNVNMVKKEIISVLKDGRGSIKDLFTADGRSPITTRKRLSNMDLSDSFYWGIVINKYNPGNSKIPDFPIEFHDGWWPVTSCDFGKSNVSSREFKLPNSNIAVPEDGERSTDLTIALVDNSRHAITYWLEEYTRIAYDVKTNVVVPYKRLTFDIEIYQYDRTMTTLYYKNLLCVIKNRTNVFNGTGSHVTEEPRIEFSIVGEIINE